MMHNTGVFVAHESWVVCSVCGPDPPAAACNANLSQATSGQFSAHQRKQEQQ